MEFIFFLDKDVSMKVIGKRIIKMEQVEKTGGTMIIMKENLKMVKRMVQAYIIGKMILFIKENG